MIGIFTCLLGWFVVLSLLVSSLNKQDQLLVNVLAVLLCAETACLVTVVVKYLGVS
jgi:hypothetical protein